MPFDQVPQKPRRQRVRILIFAVRAPDLKEVIVDAALAGIISTRQAEDLISEYGLRHL